MAKWKSHGQRTILFVPFLVFFPAFCFAQDYTIPGEITTPYPTVINLAVEWHIQGDNNQNGIVTVQFREKDKLKWQQGMPLRRVPAGENKSALSLPRKVPGYTGFKWENKHSGSIFDCIKDLAEETTARREFVYSIQPVNGTDHSLIEKQYEGLLQEAVNQLPPLQKQIFRLAKIVGLSHQAIAEKLHISRLTVKTHMAKACRPFAITSGITLLHLFYYRYCVLRSLHDNIVVQVIDS